MNIDLNNLEKWYGHTKSLYEGKDKDGNPKNFTTKEKVYAYSKLISQIESSNPDIVTHVQWNVFADFYLNDLFSNQFHSLLGYRRGIVDWPDYKNGGLIHAIIYNIVNFHADFLLYEKETNTQLKEREKKLAEYDKSHSELYPTKDTKYQYNPDRIYLPRPNLWGVYTFWYKYHTDRFYQLFWCIWKETSNEKDFEPICELFCTYIALVNELRNAKDKLADEQEYESLYKIPTTPENGISYSHNARTREEIAKELLNKPKFMPILRKAIEAGFVESKADGGYKWNGQKNELAYFAELVSDELQLCHKQSSDKGYQTAWQPFECLFGIKKLRGAANDYKRTGALPKRAKEIEALIS